MDNKSKKASDTIAKLTDKNSSEKSAGGDKKGVNLLSIVKKLGRNRAKSKDVEEKGEKEDKKETPAFEGKEKD